tara:strand:- start:8336 stop:8476 length:141 start_codon:yes stop_codon:yes gene_type:complete
MKHIKELLSMALIMMCNLAFAGHKNNCITIDAWRAAEDMRNDCRNK